MIILLTIVALEILLSRLNGFFEANAMAGKDRQIEPIPVGHWNADDQERMGPYFFGVFLIRIWIARVRRTQSAAVLRALRKNYTGVQCKKKGIWPPADLTTSEIDEEVVKAKTWKPGLKHYTIATTALNDQKAQDHARERSVCTNLTSSSSIVRFSIDRQ